MTKAERIEALRRAVTKECEELAARRARARELAGTVRMGEFPPRK